MDATDAMVATNAMASVARVASVTSRRGSDLRGMDERSASQAAARRVANNTAKRADRAPARPAASPLRLGEKWHSAAPAAPCDALAPAADGLLERMAGLTTLAGMLEARFTDHLESLDPEAPRHRVEFSGRITESWALIYYRRHLVRLSPYLFLLEPDELKHGTHWRELDATLRHEAAHAVAFHRYGETGHTERFHLGLSKLGVMANGTCDLGPENAAFRYVYACPVCDNAWHRRATLRGKWSCGVCAPGRYSPEHALVLREERDLASRLRARRAWIAQATREGLAALHPPLVTIDLQARIAAAARHAAPALYPRAR